MTSFPASKIYKLQHQINILSGRDSVQCGREWPSENRRDACFDYFIAIFSEVNELMDNFVWKHWAAEAKSGHRWALVDKQNLYVEIADLWLFVTSICQCAGVTSREYADVCVKLSEGAPRRAPGKRIVESALSLSLAAQFVPDAVAPKDSAIAVLIALIRLTTLCGISAEQIAKLYIQKAQIHKERMLRGRKQHGDTLSEIENKRVGIAK